MLYFCRDKKFKKNCVDYRGFGIIGWNGFPSYYYDSNHCPHLCQVNDFFLNYTVPWIREVLGGERKLLPRPPKAQCGRLVPCIVWLKPLFQSSQKRVRSALRVLASNKKELTANKQALRVLFNSMQALAASCEPVFAMTGKEALGLVQTLNFSYAESNANDQNLCSSSFTLDSAHEKFDV